MESFGLFQFEFVVLSLCLVFAVTYQKPVWAAIGLLASVFLAFFTRSWHPAPDHVWCENCVVSPCEGEVVDIRRVKRLDREMHEVSVFLNIHNIHIQYAPVDGVITGQRRVYGKFKPAKYPVARDNFKVTTTFQTAMGPVILEQISGFLVRKIRSFKTTGDSVKRGEPLGMIKFGSRCQLYLPADVTQIAVKVGDKVKIGQRIGDITG